MHVCTSSKMVPFGFILIKRKKEVIGLIVTLVAILTVWNVLHVGLLYRHNGTSVHTGLQRVLHPDPDTLKTAETKAEVNLHPEVNLPPKDSLSPASQRPIDPFVGEIHSLDALKRLNFKNSKVAGYTRNYTAYVTLAVPTVRRPVIGSLYLMQTLDSLLRSSIPEEREQMVVVIYLADKNQTYNNELLQKLTLKYGEYLQNGFMNVIQAPPNLYPSFEGLKRNYGDSEDRVRWRSREVIDSAFMYHQCVNLSTYFIQLEDDVLSAPGYFSSIQKFVKANDKKTWAILDLTSHGSTGKLMKNSDLKKLTIFMFTFFEEKPVDYLMADFRKLLTQADNIASNPIIFQHMGGRSSLEMKGKRTVPKVKPHFKQTWTF